MPSLRRSPELFSLPLTSRLAPGSGPDVRKPDLRFGRMQLEILSLGGVARTGPRRRLAPDRMSTQFPMPGNMTAWSECWADWKRYARYSAAAFVPHIRSNCWFSLLRNRRVLESDVWAAGCCLEASPPKPPKN